MPKTKTSAAKAESSTQKLERLRADAQAIHDARYRQNEAWNAQLAGINSQIVELEGQLRNEEAAGGA